MSTLTVKADMNMIELINKTGELKNLLSAYGLKNDSLALSLRLRGEINGNDVKTLRELTSLSELDLSKVTIVAGGEPYYESNKTEDGVIGPCFLSGMANLQRILLPQSAWKIDDCAFEDCTGITEICIPANITDIGSGVFSGCSNLRQVIFEDGEECLYFRPDAQLPFKGCPVRYMYLGRSFVHEGEVTTPWYDGNDWVDGWDYIEDNTPFSEMGDLQTITFGEKVDCLGNYALMECHALKSICFPFPISLGWATFHHCFGLTEVVVANNEVDFDEDAFNWCEALNTIIFTEDVSKIEARTLEAAYYCFKEIYIKAAMPPNIVGKLPNEFGKVSGITKLYVPKESIAIYQTTAPWNEIFEILTID